MQGRPLQRQGSLAASSSPGPLFRKHLVTAHAGPCHMLSPWAPESQPKESFRSAWLTVPICSLTAAQGKPCRPACALARASYGRPVFGPERPDWQRRRLRLRGMIDMIIPCPWACEPGKLHAWAFFYRVQTCWPSCPDRLGSRADRYGLFFVNFWRKAACIGLLTACLQASRVFPYACHDRASRGQAGAIWAAALCRLWIRKTLGSRRRDTGKARKTAESTGKRPGPYACTRDRGEASQKRAWPSVSACVLRLPAALLLDGTREPGPVSLSPLAGGLYAKTSH